MKRKNRRSRRAHRQITALNRLYSKVERAKVYKVNQRDLDEISTLEKRLGNNVR